MQPSDDPASVESYEAAVLASIGGLIAGMQRGGLLLDVYPQFASDTVWRAAACAEFQSWRTVLDALPAQVPPRYHEVHARLLRWAEALAAVGDAYAAAIAARSVSQLAQAQRVMQEIPALYLTMQEAVVQLSEVTDDESSPS